MRENPPGKFSSGLTPRPSLALAALCKEQNLGDVRGEAHRPHRLALILRAELVVAAHEEDARGVEHFEREEQRHHVQLVRAAVDLQRGTPRMRWLQRCGSGAGGHPIAVEDVSHRFDVAAAVVGEPCQGDVVGTGGERGVGKAVGGGIEGCGAP